MSDERAPMPADSPPGRGAPLLICAELPPKVFAWADALRRAHYPTERNRLGAHVTLFHGLPPSAEGEVRRLVGEAARRAPPAARISGVMDLDTGTAFSVESSELVQLHEDLAEPLHGVIQQRDARPLRLHITVQDKVPRGAARALQAELAGQVPDLAFRFPGLGLYAWTGALWQRTRTVPFRG